MLVNSLVVVGSPFLLAILCCLRGFVVVGGGGSGVFLFVLVFCFGFFTPSLKEIARDRQKKLRWTIHTFSENHGDP